MEITENEIEEMKNIIEKMDRDLNEKKCLRNLLYRLSIKAYKKILLYINKNENKKSMDNV